MSSEAARSEHPHKGANSTKKHFELTKNLRAEVGGKGLVRLLALNTLTVG